MSGIAGIIRFDGAPVEPGQIEAMTAAIAHRGPDGIAHWARGPVSLGHCMLRTTPESLEETQPLADEDASLVLVMDGRVDNWAELRTELIKRGAVLRTRTDAELVLRAYEVWGEACPDRIIGEYAFFVWDARQQRLFGARDAAGTRHFYYHADRGWFAFASEIKGLLALDSIEARLNESRVFDYLVPEFDRDDVVGTFYQDIDRLPAGHAMTVDERGVKTWRYWNPGDLPENRFASLEECGEAFLEQMRLAVKARLRSIGPVGAMLSGGLDSSSIVGLIRKEFRNDLSQPLRAFSLIREDRENCKDWEHIEQMLKEGWIEPTISTSAVADEQLQFYLDSIGNIDQPFALSHGLGYFVVYHAAREKGCNIVLDGIAGDLLFYSLPTSLTALFRSRTYRQIPAVLAAYKRHEMSAPLRSLVRSALAARMPRTIKPQYRKLRSGIPSSTLDLTLLQRDTVRPLLEARLAQRIAAMTEQSPRSDQSIHAQRFTSGLLSFAHEVYGEIAFSAGVEPRSPFSDRRMLEFAIQMPLQAKLATGWFKNTLRHSMADVLPENVRWRADLGNHPGWKFYERLFWAIKARNPGIFDTLQSDGGFARWIDHPGLNAALAAVTPNSNDQIRHRILVLVLLQHWLVSRRLAISLF